MAATAASASRAPQPPLQQQQQVPAGSGDSAPEHAAPSLEAARHALAWSDELLRSIDVPSAMRQAAQVGDAVPLNGMRGTEPLNGGGGGGGGSSSSHGAKASVAPETATLSRRHTGIPAWAQRQQPSRAPAVGVGRRWGSMAVLPHSARGVGAPYGAHGPAARPTPPRSQWVATDSRPGGVTAVGREGGGAASRVAAVGAPGLSAQWARGDSPGHRSSLSSRRPAVSLDAVAEAADGAYPRVPSPTDKHRARLASLRRVMSHTAGHLRGELTELRGELEAARRASPASTGGSPSPPRRYVGSSAMRLNPAVGQDATRVVHRVVI